MRVDTITKDYVKDVGIFADIFNFYIYGGEQVILPEQLTERDSAKIALPYGADGATVPVQKFRDVQKLYATMIDGKLEYVLYGVENQTETNYAMAVIEAVTNSGIKYEEGEEVVDVCQAIQEMRLEERRLGEQEGERKGELKKARETAGKLHEMGLDTEKIAQVVGYAAETVKEWLGLK